MKTLIIRKSDEQSLTSLIEKFRSLGWAVLIR